MKQHAKILKLAKNYIFSDTFLDLCRASPEYFTRKRSLPFTTLVLFLINFLKGSIQDELSWFFKHINNSVLPIAEVSASAFCQARKKLKPDTFRILNSKFITVAYQHQKNLRHWKGFRLVAADGTSIHVPDSPQILDHFGNSTNSVGTITPMAQVLGLYDPLNAYMIDCEIGGFKSDERKQLYSLLDRLRKNDLLLLDRGFPAYWVFSAILSQGTNFLCRLPIGKWKIAKELLTSGQKEQLITLKADSKNRETCQHFNLPTEELKLRIIHIVLPNGDSEVLITNLTDFDEYPYEDFSDLYHKRWWIEEDFKLLKSRLKIETFTGISPLAIYQDFHAKLFAHNVAMLLKSSADQALAEQGKKKKHRHQTNRTQVISKLKDILVTLFSLSLKKLERIILDIHLSFLGLTAPIRENRQFSRKRKRRKRSPVHYKPTR